MNAFSFFSGQIYVEASTVMGAGKEKKNAFFQEMTHGLSMHLPPRSVSQLTQTDGRPLGSFFFLFFTIPTHLISPARLCWSALLARYRPVTLMVPVQLGWTPTWAATKIVSLRAVLVPIISDPKSNKRCVSYSWKIKKIKKKEPQCHFKSLQV